MSGEPVLSNNLRNLWYGKPTSPDRRAGAAIRVVLRGAWGAALCAALLGLAQAAEAATPVITSVSSPSPGKITLSWLPYPIGQPMPLIQVFRNGTKVGQVSAASTSSYTDSGLQPDTRYEYIVRALYATGVYDSRVFGRTAANPQNVKGAPSITNLGGDRDSISLEWASATAYSKYLVRWWPKGQPQHAGEATYGRGGRSGAFTIPRLKAGTTYTIIVKGGVKHLFDYDYGPWSTPVDWTTMPALPLPPPPLDAPTNVYAVRQGPTSAETIVTWTGSRNAEWYVIERYYGTAPPAPPVGWSHSLHSATAKLPRGTSRHTLQSFVPSGGYKLYYRVVAYNGEGEASSVTVAEVTDTLRFIRTPPALKGAGVTPGGR